MLPYQMVFIFLCVNVWCVVSSNEVHASQAGEAIVVTIENDVFTGSDDSYSNGFSVSWISAEQNQYADDTITHNIIDKLAFLPGVNLPQGQHYWSWTLSQEMHTPENISVKEPDPNDQPYSGFLLADFSLHSLYENWGQAWNLRLGMVGPSTRAGETQKIVHAALGSQDPQGWDAQVSDEAVINLGYVVGFKLIEKPISDQLFWRAIPLATAELGTYSTLAGGGVLFELGAGGAEPLGICGLSNGVRTACAIGSSHYAHWRVTSYFATGYYRVFHYLPIYGPVFKSGPSAAMEDDPVVNFTNAGVAVRKASLAFIFGVAYGVNPADSAGGKLDYGTFTFVYGF